MKALILAAGRGVRLNEITEGLPKSLLDINGISLIQRQINQLKRNNIWIAGRNLINMVSKSPEERIKEIKEQI